ncbi:hypothetical protein [Streptomyces aureus]
MSQLHRTHHPFEDFEHAIFALADEAQGEAGIRITVTAQDRDGAL